MSSSAPAQVFVTVELVELILTNLSLRDLLAAQRVNYLFHAIVQRNKKIQKTRYLLPDNSISLETAGYAESNPLYLQRFVQQACFFALQQLNPKVHFLGMDRFVRQRTKAFADRQANWKNMLLFQPPVRSALLKSMSSHYDDGYYYINNVEGLKMGDVVEFFQKAREKDPRKAIDLLSATVTRKVVWSVTPAIATEDDSE